MINPADYAARGWEVLDCYAHLLPPGLMEKMRTHPESAGLSSQGTRNILHAFILSMRPKSVLEIGAHIGNGAIAMGAALKANNFGMLYSLEPQDHYFNLLSGFVDEAGLSNYVMPLQKYSTDESLPSYFKERVDIIYLDARHDYSAVIEDLTLADRLLAPNGLVFLDDVGKEHSSAIDAEQKGGVRQALIDFAQANPAWRYTFFEHPFWLNPCGLALACKQGSDASA